MVSDGTDIVRRRCQCGRSAPVLGVLGEVCMRIY